MGATGRPRTTLRGRAAGGRELRTWVSAAEYAQAEERARAAGMELGEYIRRAVLGHAGVTAGLTDLGLAGLLTAEGIQPPSADDLEWVRGRA